MSFNVKHLFLHRSASVAKLSASLCKRYLTSTIIVVGKKNAGEDFINDGCLEYEKRLQTTMNINTIYLKSDEHLVDACLGNNPITRGTVFALDENGSQYGSRKFSSVLYKGLEDGGAHVTFIIGGFAGLPPSIKEKFNLFSLSKMTWTHQMARLLLLEQIYRGVEIRKGSAYHKD